MKGKSRMSILPEGEELRKAVKWISEERQTEPEANLTKLIESACIKFDLSPKDAEFLCQFYKKDKEKLIISHDSAILERNIL